MNEWSEGQCQAAWEALISIPPEHREALAVVMASICAVEGERLYGSTKELLAAIEERDRDLARLRESGAWDSLLAVAAALRGGADG